MPVVQDGIAPWYGFMRNKGESLHCALLLDYVPPEEPPSTPLGNALRIR